MTVDKLQLLDSYGSLIANDGAGALVATLTFTNNGTKRQNVENSYLKLYVDNMEYSTEKMNLDDDALPLNVALEPGESVTGNVIWGVSSEIASSGSVVLEINDILYTQKKEVELQVATLVFQVSNATVKADDAKVEGEFISNELEGFAIKVGNPWVGTLEEARVD